MGRNNTNLLVVDFNRVYKQQIRLLTLGRSRFCFTEIKTLLTTSTNTIVMAKVVEQEKKTDRMSEVSR